MRGPLPDSCQDANSCRVNGRGVARHRLLESQPAPGGLHVMETPELLSSTFSFQVGTGP